MDETLQNTLLGLLDEIEQRANAATPGPWSIVRYCNYDGFSIQSQLEPSFGCIAERWENVPDTQACARSKMRLANAELIAAARSDVPALSKAVRHLRDCIKAECGEAVAQACDMEIGQLLRERDSADSVGQRANSDTASSNQTALQIVNAILDKLSERPVIREALEGLLTKEHDLLVGELREEVETILDKRS